MPAIIYYCINSSLLSYTKKKKNKSSKQKNKVNNKKNDQEKEKKQRVKKEKKQKLKKDSKKINNKIKQKPIIEKNINEVNTKPVIKVKKVKTRYCKHCGGKLNENKKCIKCGKQYFRIRITKSLPIIILSVILIISFAFNIFLVLNINNKNGASKSEVKKLHNKINRLEEEIDSMEDENWDLTQEKDEYEEKADFLDENIVFVIEGYGNYYYTYDCMNKVTNGEYSYWAYNEEAAIYNGYRKETCN